MTSYRVYRRRGLSSMISYRVYGEPSDDIYYRIHIQDDDTWSICCVQWFDESHYDKFRWLHHGGTPVWFATEEEAQSFINTEGPFSQRVRRDASIM